MPVPFSRTWGGGEDDMFGPEVVRGDTRFMNDATSVKI